MNFKKLYKSELRRLLLQCEEECLYYNKENGTCQSKKCATGGDGTVTLLDRICCEPWKGEKRMRDLIDRQAAIDALTEMYCKSDEDGYVWIIRGDACLRIDALPSVDAVEVVRCKDCRWWDAKEDGYKGYCHAAKHGYYSRNWEIGIYRLYGPDFFCADGEVRGEEG